MAMLEAKNRAYQDKRGARDTADHPLASGLAERQRTEHNEQGGKCAGRPQRQREGARQRIEPRNPGHTTIHRLRD